MGFFDFLKKTGVVKSGAQTWNGDAKDRPLDDPDQQQKMADLDHEIGDSMDNNDSTDNGSSD